MISICIPTYSQNGSGIVYFKRLLNSILAQECPYRYEIVVSDNCSGSEIKNVCAQFPQLSIRYFKNKRSFGVSNNTNNAISKARFKFIKPMFQDDIFITKHSLKKFIEALHDNKWVISSSHLIDKDDKYMSAVKANYGNNFKDILNINTIGMPSVIAFRSCSVKFRPELKQLLDTFFYLELFNRLGLPFVMDEFLIGQRVHQDSISAIQGDRRREDSLLLKKYNII